MDFHKICFLKSPRNLKIIVYNSRYITHTITEYIYDLWVLITKKHRNSWNNSL